MLYLESHLRGALGHRGLRCLWRAWCGTLRKCIGRGGGGGGLGGRGGGRRSGGGEVGALANHCCKIEAAVEGVGAVVGGGGRLWSSTSCVPEFLVMS